MLTISATFDMHLLLPAHIFVTLAYLVHIHIERCIPHSLIPSWIPDKVSDAYVIFILSGTLHVP
jgi:hypothetical protein